MKKIVEMHFCDICGEEVRTENRYTIRLAALTNWNYDANIDVAHEKDMCPDCYNTILQLIGEHQADKQPKMLNEPLTKRGKLTEDDMNKLYKMWAYGVQQKEIAKRLGVSANTISYHLSRLSEEKKPK